MGAKFIGGIVGLVVGVFVQVLFQINIISPNSSGGFASMLGIFGNFYDIVLLGVAGLIFGILIGHFISKRTKQF